LVRGFRCYAHADRVLAADLFRLLGPRLQINNRGLDLSIWSDEHVLVGELWDAEIRRAIAAADFALLLLSPAFLSRAYLKGVEIPLLLAAPGTLVMPVGLQRVDLARSDLQGLDGHQIFRFRDPSHEDGRWFADLRGENRARFADELATQIVDRLVLPTP